MGRYYTVVYYVDGDKAACDAWWQTAIDPLFLTDSRPISVSVISAGDEVSRLDCVARIIERGLSNAETVDAINAILVHPDPSAWWRENGGEAA